MVEANVKRMQAFCPSCAPPRSTWGGTSRLARRLTTILPAMRLVEALDPTRIHRVAGRTGDR
jgi:predicted ATPase with chaperone activity